MRGLHCLIVPPQQEAAEPLVTAFFFHNRNDGWEKAMFRGPQECGCCGKSDWFGWLEMESDAIRCNDCVPPEEEKP